MQKRAAVRVTVSLPADTGSVVVSGFKTGATILIFRNLHLWLSEGRRAYLSSNNVVCVYDEIMIDPYIMYIVDIFKMTFHHCPADPDMNLIRKCKEHCLGVDAQGQLKIEPSTSSSPAAIVIPDVFILSPSHPES